VKQLKKSIARQLVLKIRECEKQFSNPNRELNTNKETFQVHGYLLERNRSSSFLCRRI
jgi:hypothetical protein